MQPYSLGTINFAFKKGSLWAFQNLWLQTSVSLSIKYQCVNHFSWLCFTSASQCFMINNLFSSNNNPSTCVILILQISKLRFHNLYGRDGIQPRPSGFRFHAFNHLRYGHYCAANGRRYKITGILRIWNNPQLGPSWLICIPSILNNHSIKINRSFF